MAKKPIYLTTKGLEEKKAELRHLIEVRRPQISENMGQAIADGDLRESAAYDEARMEQSSNEARIADLEEIINSAVVIAEGSLNGEARIGATLELKMLEGPSVGEVETYHLVGTHEADFLANRISDESDFGKQLVGKKQGDIVEMKRKNPVRYEVLNVSF